VTTLITVGNSEGIVGRCDAKCYNAAGPDCDCICQGRNHGKGKAQAVELTAELGERWVDQWEKAHPGQRGTVVGGSLMDELF
jgi:hypothetical protein